MTLAINDAGDLLSDAGGSWKPAMRAVNDKTGETLVLDGGAWAPLPAPKATPDVTGTTEFPGYAAAEASHAPLPKLDSVLDRSNAAFSQDAEAGVAPDRMAGTPLHMPEPDSTPVTMSNGQRVKPLPYEIELRSFLKPDPDAASVLPVAGTIDEGTLRPAVPSSLGELGTGVLDLLHGPETGSVTPEATGALATGIGSRALGMRSGLATSAVPESAAAVDAVRAIGSAQDVDGAIAAASRAVVTPGDSVAPVSQLSREQAAVRAMRDRANGEASVVETPPALTGEVLPPQAPITTSAAAKEVGHAWYQKADEVGAELPPSFSDDLVDAAEKIAPQTTVGRAVAGDTEVTKLVDRLQAIRGEPITLHGAQEIYEYLGDAISKEYGLKGLSKDGHNLMQLQTTFWNMIMDANPGEVQGGMEGFKAWETGRVAWAQAMKMIDVERIISRAEQTDNPATSIKSGVRTLLNSSRSRGFDTDEIAALKQAGDRGAVGGLLHVFGSRLIPYAAGAVGASGGVFGAMLGAGAGYAGSTLMRSAATRLQTGRANNALRVLGESVPPAPQ